MQIWDKSLNWMKTEIAMEQNSTIIGLTASMEDQNSDLIWLAVTAL